MTIRQRDTIRGTTSGVRASARELRWKMTPAEQTLWQALKGRQLGGLRFRTQHPVGSFILDFYCPSHKLVIEVDGAIHDRHREQDEYRTKHLEAYGYTVLRFSNDEVLTDLASVLVRIADAASALGVPPRPPNPGGSQPSPRHRLSDLAQSHERHSPPRIGGPGGRT